jgi:uncharacterized protein (DUF849 family)
MPCTFGAFDVGCTRVVAMLAVSGRIRGPVLHKVFLSEGWAVGPLPTAGALDLHLDQLPDDLDVEWFAVPYSHSDPAVIEHLSRAALERGGHVRIGLGDSPTANPSATNAELVEQVVQWAQDAGRPAAGPADVRARLGLAVI